MITLRKMIAKRKAECPYSRGYWLVRESDNARFFIGDKASPRALEILCDKVLSDSKGWGYWVDYCLGLDVHTRIAWTNLDLSSHFGV